MGQTGVTKETLQRFLLDAGAVYLNYGEPEERLLGATRGGNSFVVEAEFKSTEIDGVKGELAGARRIINVMPQLTTNLLEMTADNFMQAIPGSTGTETEQDGTEPATQGEGTHQSIRRTSQAIPASAHIKNIAFVGETSSGSEGVFMIYNGINDGSLELSTEDKNESTLEITFKGHFDAEDLQTEPWEIRWPKEPAV